MDPRLQSIITAHGVFLRREACAVGHDDASIAAMLRHREWVRVRHGCYTAAALWSAADPVERHRILSRAVLRSLTGRAALSHVSALAEHGIALWGADLSRVHVTRLDGAAGRRQRDTVHHEGLAPDEDLCRRGGLLLTSPARAVVESTALLTVEAAVVSADSALHQSLTDRETLTRTHARLQTWPRIRRTHAVLAFADGGSESPGESRSRYLFACQALPAPTLQVPVHDASGTLVGVTDFGWLGHGLLGEFDGRVKYGRLLREGETAADAVYREKQREDRIRELTGARMVRLTWDDLARPAATAARVRRLLRQAA